MKGSGSVTLGMIFVMLFYLINPVYYLIEFFMWTMTGTSGAYEILADYYRSFSKTIPFHEAACHYVWMAVSTILFLLLSFLFLWIAAKRISPVSKRKAKKLAQIEMQREMHG